MSITTYFDDKLAGLDVKAQKMARKLNLVATFRVGWFLIFLILFVYLINIRQLSIAIISFVVFTIGFGLLVILYNRLKFKLDQNKFLGQVCEEEKSRLANELSELPGGEDYLEASHSYAADLDIFGAHSIFQLINRTSTIQGEALLANRLKGESLPVNSSPYQETVSKIAENPDFIQEHQALGKHFEFDKEEYENFKDWLNDDEELSFVSNQPWLLLALPGIFFLGFIVISALSITYYALLPVIAVNLYLLGINHARTSKVVEQTATVVKLLNTYRRHIRLIRETEINTDFAKSMQANFANQDTDAEKEIAYLSRLLDQLQSRNNLLHIFINLPLLLDLQWMRRLHLWKTQHRESMSTWVSSLAEFEVLVSLAGTSFLNPDWQYPALVEDDYILDGRDLGHPLIHASNRVCNDFTLSGSGKAIIITGPNMAGKSTFLRTVALNVILAQMGGAVCAAAMTLSKEMDVFTAMRSQDNLGENISSFYAELDRIQQLLKKIEAGTKVFYFLDELLKGTNSADRHKGAEALVKQLISLKVSGIVSTHDIELGKLTSEKPEVSNFSFESTITDGEIDFDYKIRQGVCSSFNASELMRQMGIKL